MRQSERLCHSRKSKLMKLFILTLSIFVFTSFSQPQEINFSAKIAHDAAEAQSNESESNLELEMEVFLDEFYHLGEVNLLCLDTSHNFQFLVSDILPGYRWPNIDPPQLS